MTLGMNLVDSIKTVLDGDAQVAQQALVQVKKRTTR
jgi:hypothetical protein